MDDSILLLEVRLDRWLCRREPATPRLLACMIMRDKYRIVSMD